MKESTWPQVKELFAKALELPPPERGRFLRQTTPDANIIAEVLRLLEEDSAADGFLEPVTPSLVHALKPPQPALAAPGARIGRYTVEVVVATGGMGTVFRAVQDQPRRTVALKTMRHGFDSASARNRFHYESEILGKLSHPSIAHILEAGIHREGELEYPYFAMEFIEGGRDLLAFAADRGLTVPDRLELFLKVCDAVHHGHQRGVIHRDLKPANILVDPGGQPKIIDFGIARATEADALGVRAVETQEGQLIGTLQYMSPEQVDPKFADVDTRSDVYSLGVILYELLAGSPPYELAERSLAEAVVVLRDTEPPRPSRMRKELPAELDWICQKALAKDPARRYASASELAADLRRVLAHEPVEAGPPSRWYRLHKFCRRHRWPVAAGAAVFLGTLTAAVAIGWQAKLANQRYQEIIQLADIRELRALEEEAQSLWPVHPASVPPIEHWIARANALTANLPAHRATLDRLARSLQVSQDPLETPAPASAGREESWQYERLVSLITGLESLSARADDIGTIQEMRQRLKRADTLWQRSIGDYELDWEDAITEIFLSHRYHELELVPQVGLVPLSPDQESGLWEFWHVESGERPVREAETGELKMDAQTGLVFVLVPETEFLMGAQYQDPEASSYDPHALVQETPPHPLLLPAFFLSKYEMTQGQWTRLMGSNPSVFSVPDEPLVNPVENVSWFDCKTALERVALTLPSEAQWECAYRAGTQTIWWCGAERTCLNEAENIRDQSWLAAHEPFGYTHDPITDAEEWNDNSVLHASVGSYRPNPFGFHDMGGNVSEWCRDWFAPYEVESGVDGQDATPVQGHRVTRGANYFLRAEYARAAYRSRRPPHYRLESLGVRPAQAVDTE